VTPNTLNEIGLKIGSARFLAPTIVPANFLLLPDKMAQGGLTDATIQFRKNQVRDTTCAQVLLH
jgi:hypothetical protein